MESDSETFYSLPGSGRKIRVPIKVKRGKVVSPTGVQNFDFDDDCPDDERMALKINASYMSQEGEETVLLEGDETEAEMEARRIKREMEEDEATHFTEGLGEEILLPEDSDDEEVNEMFDELEGTFDPDSSDFKHAMEAVETEEEKKEEEPSDLEPTKITDDADVDVEADVEAPNDPSDTSDAPETEKAEDDAAMDSTKDEQLASEEASEPEEAAKEEEIDADTAQPKLLATVDTTSTQEPEDQDEEETTKPEEPESDITNVKGNPEGKDLACSTNTTEETQEPDDQENAEAEPEVAEQVNDAASLNSAPDDEQQTDTEQYRKFISRRASGDDESSASGRNELIFAPAVGEASDTDYVTASDTDYNTATDYATTDYGTETDYGTTDYATSFDYDTEANRDVDDSVSVNQSVTHSVAHSVANSIAADSKGPRTKKNEKERSKWSLFGCGIVEEVPSTKQEWWNFVLDSTEGALQTVGGNHWDDPWHEDEDEFDDDFDAKLNRNRSDRPRRRTRSASTSRAGGGRRTAAARARRYRRATSAPRARTTLPKRDRRKQLV